MSTRQCWGTSAGRPQGAEGNHSAERQDFYNMDGLHGGSCAFHRIKTRVIPHNVYTNTAVMLRCAAKKGYPTTYQGLPRACSGGDTDPSLLPASQSILIAYRAENVGYQFDPATDSYIRSEDSKLEIDASNNQQVRARSIVVHVPGNRHALLRAHQSSADRRQCRIRSRP